MLYARTQKEMNMKIKDALRKVRTYLATNDGVITAEMIHRMTKYKNPYEVEHVINWLEYFGEIKKIENKKGRYKINRMTPNERIIKLTPKIIELIKKRPLSVSEIIDISGISRSTVYRIMATENEKEQSVEQEEFEIFEEEDKEVFQLFKIKQAAKKKFVNLSKGSFQIYIPTEYIDLSEINSYDIFTSNKRKARIVFYKTNMGTCRMGGDKAKPSTRHVYSFKAVAKSMDIKEHGKYSCKVTKTSVTIDFNNKID